MVGAQATSPNTLRHMFDLSITEAAITLDNAIDTTDDIEKYVNGYRSVSAEGTVNRLFSWFHDSKNPTFGLVSNYVARRLAIRLGPDFVQKISKLLLSNPSMDGHFFELWFFAKLLYGDLSVLKLALTEIHFFMMHGYRRQNYNILTRMLTFR